MLWVHVVFCLVFTAIAARAVNLQVLNAPVLKQTAREQWEGSFETIPSRGVIYDSRFRELAVSLDVYSVAAHPLKIRDAAAAAGALAPLLNQPEADIRDRLSSNRGFVWLKRQPGPRVVDAVRELGIEGLAFVREKRRYYPNRGLAAQVLGFCGVDGGGLEGLEFHFNDVLAGESASWSVFRDALGGTITQDVPPEEPGAASLVLTIDRTIQYLAEEALEEVVREYGAKSATAVVMEPETGAVLAMANVPRVNPNSIFDYTASEWRNRAVTDMFEPGSTLKVFTAASALESGMVRPDSVFFCENGVYRMGREAIHDTHSYGWLSLAQIVKFSSNIGAVKVGEAIGQKRLHDTLRAFGFGERTRVDCPGETPGIVRPANAWTPVDAGAAAFGQGVSVSCVQLASAFSAIANDGVLMRPMLVQAVLDSGGGVLKSFKPTQVRRAVSVRTAQVVNRIMRTVLTPDGTGELARLDGYTVCGKTGTAQVPSKQGGYEEDKYVASFAGFAPADNPRITVVVVVNEPTKSCYGGVVAAPAFKRICEKTLQYLNVAPDAGETRRTAWIEVEDRA